MLSGNILGSRRGRLAAFGVLYVAEGLPLGFAAIAMAAYMHRQGLGTGQIGAFVGAFYLPWGFKWAWAPLVDLVRLERFGGRKAWIVLCQVLMIVTLAGVAQIDYARHFDLLITLVLIHNVFSATQDVAIDALAINTLPEDERATANGFMFAGAYVGQGLGGGVAMFVVDRWGFGTALVYVCMVLAAILAFVLLLVKDASVATRGAHERPDLWSALRDRLRTFLQAVYEGFFRSGRGPLAGVAFALLPMGAMALSGAISTTLQVDLGMSDAQIGALNIYQIIAAAGGCIAGGWAADHLGQRRMLALWYLLTMLPTLYLAAELSTAEGVAGVTIAQYHVASIAFSWCMGMHYGTAAALFMGLTNPLVAATQFTAYMALRNVVISYSNWWQGELVESHGYALVLYLDAFLVLLPVLLIPFLEPRHAPAQDYQTVPSLDSR